MAEELAKLNFTTRSAMESMLLLMGFTKSISNGRRSMWQRPLIGRRMRIMGKLVVNVYERSSKVTEAKKLTDGQHDGAVMCLGSHDDALEYLKERIDEAKRQAEGRA